MATVSQLRGFTRLVRGITRRHCSTFRRGAEEVVEQADYLYSCGETEKLYQLLLQYKDSDDAEFLWRLARASRDLSLLPDITADQKKKLTYEAFNYAKKALEKNEVCFAAHKALEFFLKAEAVDSNYYSMNLLMIGKTYIMLKDQGKALLWLNKARDYPAITIEDKEVHKEAVDLLKKLNGLWKDA